MGVDPIKQEAFADLIKFLALEDYLGYACDTAMQPQLYTFAKSAAGPAGLTVSGDKKRVISFWIPAAKTNIKQGL